MVEAAKDLIAGDGVSAEQWLSQAQQLSTTALQKAKGSRGFGGRWRIIASMIERLPSCLSDLSSHPCFAKISLCCEQLQSVCRTLEQMIELAERDGLGKLQMQSELDSLSSTLDMNMKDCKLLTKTGVLGEFPTWELLARLHIGRTEAKFRAVDALLEAVIADEKRVSAVLSRSNAAALVRLLIAAPGTVLREKTATVICLLAESRSSAEMLVSEGVIPPLIRMADSTGNVFCRTKAVISLQRLSSLPEAACSIVCHGGAAALMESCRFGEDAVSRVAAAGALKNISAVAELRAQLGREGLIGVMLDLLDCVKMPLCRDYAAECLQNLTACGNNGGGLRKAAAAAGAVAKLLSFLDVSAASPAVAAVANLVGLLPPGELISMGLLPRLAGALQRGSPAAQRAAAAALCKVSAGSDEMKRFAGESGFISLLVPLLGGKTGELRTAAAQAMASLMQHLPNARSAKDPRTVPSLVRLLGGAAAEPAVACLLALSTSRQSKKAMASHGAVGYLNKLSAMDVPGSHKLLRRLRRRNLPVLFLPPR